MEKSPTSLEFDDALPELEASDVVLVQEESADDDARVREAVAAAVDEAERRLEAEFAETRGEMGARIAELEGELEALREAEAAHVRELEDLHVQLRLARDEASAARAEAKTPAPAPAAEAPAQPKLVEMLHAELAAAQETRAALEAQLASLAADRERLQDELAGQIADLAGQLAIRDAEIARLQRQGAPAGADDASTARVQELEAENEFLQAELDRLAAQVASRS